MTERRDGGHNSIGTDGAGPVADTVADQGTAVHRRVCFTGSLRIATHRLEEVGDWAGERTQHIGAVELVAIREFDRSTVIVPVHFHSAVVGIDDPHQPYTSIEVFVNLGVDDDIAVARRNDLDCEVWSDAYMSFRNPAGSQTAQGNV